MGCYDTVILHCPRCNAEYEAQSKGGECLLRTFSLKECPVNVLGDVNRHAPFECYLCGRIFQVTRNDNGTVTET